MSTGARLSTVTWISIAVGVLMLGGLAFWMYDGSRELNRLEDQQAIHWAAIEQLFRERTERLEYFRRAQPGWR